MTNFDSDADGFLIYYMRKSITMSDAAESWVEMTPDERASYNATAAELLDVLAVVYDASMGLGTVGCPGEGKCHGPMAWCERCGSVANVCDDPRCDTHAAYCETCGSYIGPGSLVGAAEGRTDLCAECPP